MDFNVLSNLPIDTGGVHQAKIYESTNAPYGHYIYTPSSYQEDGPEFPLLIFLHGSGEKGNSSIDPAKLDLVLKNGPPRLISRSAWNPRYPMIVASPQCHEGGWNSQRIHEFIEYVFDNYRVNKKRIYITGLSMGGYGTFSYVGDLGNDSYATACVPICGGGNTGKAESFYSIPTWAFHGDADGTVVPAKSIDMINAINEFDPSPKAKLTIYPGVGHNSWSMTYDGTGMGTESNEYDTFNQSIYDWMFQYEKKISEELIQ
jgi:predicted peptidase